MQSSSCDILIVGGGTGGCAAAMSASSLGMKVILTEQYPWIGGQLTSQAVPPDEHPWIEQFGCTARYRAYREGVRRKYRQKNLKPEFAANPHLNPGGGWVSRLCHDPAIGHEVLLEMLQNGFASRNLELRSPRVPVSAEVEGDHIRAVILKILTNGELERIEAKYVLDATELGDLLPLAEVEFVSGAESKAETQEPHALDGPAEPENVQGLTWVMALGFDPGGNHVIEKPAQYDRWRSYKPDFWPDRLLSFKMLHVQQGHPIDFPLFGNGSFNLFEYRQIVDPEIYRVPTEAATIANWPQNDYYDDGNIIDKSPEVVAQRLEESRQLSLSLLYWLQTEAPRHDGGTGYPELRLRGDLVGTEDGLAQAPYIRESRRIKARFTVLEQYVSTDCNPGRDRAVEFPDSVGVGAYRIDLHPSTNGVNTIDTSTLPFQIPLGSLIPVRIRNLIPAAKNLGITHITNGCYRLHPIEWNVGESAGLLAGYCIQNGVIPVQVHESAEHTRNLQELCMGQGVEIEWPKLGPL